MVISGRKGSAYIAAAAIGELKGFDYNGTLGTMKGTSLSSNYARTDGTTIDGSGTLRMLFDPDDVQQALLAVGAELEVHLYVDGNQTGDTEYTSVGNENGDKILVTSVRLAHSEDSYVEYEVGFERPLLRATV